MKEIKKSKKDIIFIAALVLLAGVALLLQHSFRQKGSVVVVYLDGEITASYPLSAAQEILLQSGSGSNRLIIRDNKAFIVEADCPDQLCVRQGAISHTGETLVCLPHRLVVEISGAEEAGYDAIVQ